VFFSDFLDTYILIGVKRNLARFTVNIAAGDCDIASVGRGNGVRLELCKKLIYLTIHLAFFVCSLFKHNANKSMIQISQA
jgi:hypothetical protein